jgi:hypothetical protein
MVLNNLSNSIHTFEDLLSCHTPKMHWAMPTTHKFAPVWHFWPMPNPYCITTLEGLQTNNDVSVYRKNDNQSDNHLITNC